jgi:hypothetical protein
VNEEQKILSTQKLLDVISKKNTTPECEKTAETPWGQSNTTKAQKHALHYLFIGVFAGVIATGGIFYLLYSPDGRSTKSATAEKVKTASSPASQENTDRNTDAEKIIQNAVVRWRTAWEQKDIDAYKAFYSTGFRTGKFDRRTWLEAKERNFQRTDGISIAIRNLSISVEDRRAVATFVQDHKSPGLTDRGIKTLIWVNENNEWKIVSEKWKPLKK